jgi:hypothetical protein
VLAAKTVTSAAPNVLTEHAIQVLLLPANDLRFCAENRVLFDHLVGLSEQRGRHGEAERIRVRGAAQSRIPLRAVLIHPIVSAVLER